MTEDKTTTPEANTPDPKGTNPDHHTANQAAATEAQLNREEAPSDKKSRKGFFGKKKETVTSHDMKVLEDNIRELETKAANMQAEAEEWKDKYLRLFSEFDNFRKRNARERIELIKSASSETIIRLLPVLDDLERALKSLTDDNELTKPFRQGVELILNKMISILEKEGLKAMQATGEIFDTDYHEALTNIPAPSEEFVGKVLEEVEKGYLLNDKVIRFAKVIVGN
jgi:molecular chaperone GrpE